jgi:pimeloyl-ACP methyl ester carboxylesterase
MAVWPGERETGRVVEALGTQLHYHDVGSGPAVLLLHSWGVGTTAWLTWHRVLPELSQRFRCLALDLPNHTRSGPLVSDETVHEMQASSALALLDALDIPRAHVVANSQGAQSALLMATRCPDRVDRLVVGAHHLGTVGGEYLLGLEVEEGIRLGSRALEEPTPANVRAYLACHLHDPELVTDDLVAYLIEQHYARPDLAPARDAMRYGEGHDLSADLTRLACPTLVLWGRRDRTCQLEIGIRTMNLIPRSRLIVLRDAGHWPPFERPQEYADHVSTFLAAQWC